MSLFAAVKTRDHALLKAAFESNPNINAPDDYGWTPLHYAFALDYPDMVEALIAKGASVSTKSKQNDTPIELGIIFKSIQSLHVVKSQLSDDPKYRILQKLETDGIAIRNTKHGLEKYRAYGELAKDYVRKERKIIANNLPGPFNNTEDAQYSLRLRRFAKVIEILKLNLRHPDGRSMYNNYAAEKSGMGNCDFQSAIVIMLCKRVFGLRKVEIFNIQRKEEVNAPEGDHIAVVLGRAEPGNDNYHYWGPHAVICDPWMDLAYPASEIESKLKNAAMDDTDSKNPVIYLIPFDPNKYDLRFNDLQDRLRLPPALTHYFDKHKEMSKKEKIQALKEASQELPTDSSISRVIKHKEENLRRFYVPH